MAQANIDIGSTPNQGTGDSIRDAFNKVNRNFDELYTFNNGTLQITGVLTAIESFGISATDSDFAPILYVVPGNTLPSVNFQWAIKKHKQQLVSQVLYQGDVPETTGTGPSIPDTKFILGTFDVTGVEFPSEDTTWQLRITGPSLDGQPIFVLTKEASLRFRYKKYWGVSNSDTPTTDEITSITFNSDWADDNTLVTSYDATGANTPGAEGRYIHYAYPYGSTPDEQFFGELTNVKVGNMPFSDYTSSSITIDDVSYKLYTFTNRHYGSNIEVSWS